MLPRSRQYHLRGSFWTCALAHDRRVGGDGSSVARNVRSSSTMTQGEDEAERTTIEFTFWSRRLYMYFPRPHVLPTAKKSLAGIACFVALVWQVRHPPWQPTCSASTPAESRSLRRSRPGLELGRGREPLTLCQRRDHLRRRLRGHDRYERSVNPGRHPHAPIPDLSVGPARRPRDDVDLPHRARQLSRCGSTSPS